MNRCVSWVLCCYAPALVGQVPSSCDAFNQVTVKIDANGEAGAGVVMKSDGRTAWIATAGHVVMTQSGDHIFKERAPLRVTFSGNATKSFPATLEYPKPRAYSLSTLDIAVLEVTSPSQDLPKASVQDLRTDELVQGEPISFTGHPGELTWQCYKDTDSISRLSYQEDDRKFVFASPQVQRGVSGGPVFDHLGRLIGIVSSKEEHGTNAIAIRIGSVKRMMVDELAVKLVEGNSCSGPTGCTTKLGDLKFITEYHDENKQASMIIKSDEKVYQLPSDWPVGPYLHLVLSAMEYDTAQAVTKPGITQQQLQQLQHVQQQAQQFRPPLPEPPPRANVAATVRKGDADAGVIFMGATALFNLRGNDGHQYQMKFYKTGAIEEMAIEVKLADGANSLGR